MNQKGLSTVVTTMIIIALVLVAAGMVWIVIHNLISEGSDEINLERLSMDLEITSVEVGGTFAYIKVKRNVGAGDLVAIKFILSDDKNSEVVEKPTDMGELETRTFRIGQSDCSFVYIPNITKVSIASVFELNSGRTSLGDIVASQNIEEVEGEDSWCAYSYDCIGEDDLVGLLDGTEECRDFENVYQKFRNFSCIDGQCYSEDLWMLKADCGGLGCENGVCLEVSVECITDEECEAFDCPSGCDPISCIGNVSYLAWTSHSCNMTDNTCIPEEVSILQRNCTNETPQYTLICGSDGNCYESIECMSTPDCYDPDPICSSTYCMCEIAFSAECVPEEMLDEGYVGSTWPPKKAEYFDSSDLGQSTNNLYANFYIGFTSGNESGGGCRLIEEYVYLPELTNAYIKIYGNPSEIATGDKYEIWRTLWNCNKRLSDLGL